MPSTTKVWCIKPTWTNLIMIQYNAVRVKMVLIKWHLSVVRVELGAK